MKKATQCRFITLTVLAALLAAKAPGRAVEILSQYGRDYTRHGAIIKF